MPPSQNYKMFLVARLVNLLEAEKTKHLRILPQGEAGTVEQVYPYTGREYSI